VGDQQQNSAGALVTLQVLGHSLLAGHIESGGGFIQQQNRRFSDQSPGHRYTLCLANPPFTGSLDYEAVSKSLLAITKTKKTELLFVSLFIRMLQTGGRCASIVPDGVLFGNSTGHKSLRKELIDNQRLQAVISMPSGVFLPYAGVSTAVIIFTKTNAGGTDKVWFYDMKADGYTLDQRRTECQENDIPDVVARFKNLDAEESRTRKEQSFLVPVEEIRANDYNLNIPRYVDTFEAEEVIDIDEVQGNIKRIKEELATVEAQMEKYLKEIGL
jgi:type I restriction enzyme M protein